MDYSKRKIDLGSAFVKLTDQDIQEPQKNGSKYAKTYQNVLEGMDMELMLEFYRSQQVQLDIMRDFYKGNPSHLFDLAHLTYALNILTNLINDKCHSQPQSPTMGNQLDDIEESSSVGKDDEQMSIIELEDYGNEKRNITSDDEDLDPLSLEITQERMGEYSRSCRGLVRECNSNEVFFRLHEEEVKLHKMKYEYKENPTNTLLLEAYYQNHVTNTLTVVLQEKREEDTSRLSTNQDEDILEDLSDKKEDESLLGPHDEQDDFENTCIGDDEAIESKVDADLTFLKDVTPDDSPLENL